MSARMKPNSPIRCPSGCRVPGPRWRPRLRSISSVTMAGSVCYRGWRAARRRPPGPSSGGVGMKSSRSRTVAARPGSADRTCPGPRGWPRGSPAKPGAWRRRRTAVRRPRTSAGRAFSLPDGQPQGLHRVGHHLLVTDGEVDVVLPVAGRRDGEQRGDRPALDDLEAVVDQAPFDVLGRPKCASIRRPSCASAHDLRIRQRRLPCRAGSIAAACGPARRQGAGWRAAWWRPPWRRSRRRAPCRSRR